MGTPRNLLMLSRPTFTMRCGRMPVLVIALVAFHLYLIRAWLENQNWQYGGVASSALLDVSEAAQNETLGFEKIYYISLPHRTDRQDMMTLLAASTNIKLALQPGVNGSNVNDKAKPKGTIVLEDDADWDVEIHDIFQTLSVQMRKGELRKRKATKYEINHAPYGLDWDLLYIGTCWDIPNGENRPKHQVYNDRFSPNSAEMTSSFRKELEDWGVDLANNTRVRVLAPSWYSVCTIGYALTNRGAQKLLYTIGNRESMGAPIDLAMIDKVQKGYLDALTIIPPLVTPWKTGRVSDSDIDNLAERKGELPSGSENLQNSARKALENSLLGVQGD
ncbi:glycosyl transferase family 25-like protein [Metarhizium robertsii]|uniref:Glycosyltransferase family 25 protein n=2 Tax=Metarhizium robertsii TaxID=568076 RepID=E9FCF0_METRA|nr:glycosyltransferase family 25 protein [Metarhizium robertsii ARSEF 23]EFY94578.1 glycosyltransferase family 25 protein [Metarhizium robertsii ARSEF 23]EXU95981.1 glycosyl transferase family 25-like protein [Metarhizium robertsii]